ncbi:[LSU ribosomal protein L11P]-lysine N-methyltransferase [Desulfuromusa kysingii]|uniref:Ribosomal protein L11 methyltransferase n=1 Tax=Desulfuromusa kysingii TaxID=37625 RepID=A0A1H3XMS1_9BACT|nr:50S ribosomal protein L11 methyltransferase [Desulfuromusa kysingii]SDZ99838.1 [LSU ribosomal protein L11P]-lysine N-methyltransferase [Desulfuromusa kysingii]
MKNEWIVIEIKVKGELVDFVTTALDDFGCSGTVVDAVSLDTFVVPDNDLNPAAIYTLQTYFPAVSDPEHLISSLMSAFKQIPVLKDQDIDMQLGGPVRMEDWSENWKQNFSAFHIGDKLVIHPSWEDYIPVGSEAVIEIDPGMAFGTGTHATTKLCLEMVAELLSRTNPPQTMLDVGTGSGILALGAAALGCPQIVANDIDPVACSVALENINKNNYTKKIEVSELSLEELTSEFDLIVANILAEENIRLKLAFMDHLRPGGWLVLSGILTEKEALVREAFAALPIKMIPSRYQDEWVCLAGQRVI